jgi:hypothetical protein
MESLKQDARLRYLEGVSQKMMIVAPVVSSFMNAEKRPFNPDREGQHNLNECSGCAQYLLPGVTCDMLKSKTPRSRRDRLAGGPAAERRVRCGACGVEIVRRRTTQRAGKSERINLPKHVTQSIQAPSLATAEPPSVPIATLASQSSSLPNRRKARGKHASLQALLADKKPEAQKKAGYGDMMDFMKT